MTRKTNKGKVSIIQTTPHQSKKVKADESLYEEFLNYPLWRIVPTTRANGDGTYTHTWVTGDVNPQLHTP